MYVSFAHESTVNEQVLIGTTVNESLGTENGDEDELSESVTRRRLSSMPQLTRDLLPSHRVLVALFA